MKACKGKGKPGDAKAGFEYSGPLVEALLLGNLGDRGCERVEWECCEFEGGLMCEAEGGCGRGIGRV